MIGIASSQSTWTIRSGALGLEVLLSPVASPKANSICERVIGTWREAIDFLLGESD